MKSKKLIAIIGLSLALSMVGCGSKNEDNKADNGKVESNNDNSDKGADDVNANSDYLDSNEYINVMFKNLIDEMPIIDEKIGECRVEDEAIARYGNPDKKENNALKYKIDDECYISVGAYDPVECPRVYYDAVNNTTAYVNSIVKSGKYDITFDLVKDYYEETKRFNSTHILFNGDYTFQNMTYKEISDLLGTEGFLSWIDGHEYPAIMEVKWYCKDIDKILTIYFNSRTGVFEEDSIHESEIK